MNTFHEIASTKPWSRRLQEATCSYRILVVEDDQATRQLSMDYLLDRVTKWTPRRRSQRLEGGSSQTTT
jgi:hypothetical protein